MSFHTTYRDERDAKAVVGALDDLGVRNLIWFNWDKMLWNVWVQEGDAVHLVLAKIMTVGLCGNFETTKGSQ